MNWDIGWLVAPLLFGALLSGLAAFSAWNRQHIAGHRPFSVFMLAIMTWQLAYAAELSTTQIDLKLLWAKAQYLPIAFTTPLLFVYAAQYSGIRRFNHPILTGIIYTIPTLTSLIIWFRTTWIWTGHELISFGEGNLLQFTYGNWFYINVGWSYLALMFGLAILVQLVWNSPTLTVRQIALMGLGILIPFGSNLMYVLGRNPVPGIDWTPYALATTGLASAWALFDFRFQDFMPVVFDVAIENLPDSVITIDRSNCIRTVNPAAERFFDTTMTQLASRPIAQIIPAAWWEKVNQANPEVRLNFEVDHTVDGQHSYYEVRTSPVYDRRNRFRGRLLLLRDITQRKKALLALAQREQELAGRVEARTAELRNANERLLRTSRMKDEFLASMSHELRTPLNAVIGTAEAMRETVYGDVTTAQVNSLRRIEDSAQHLLSLINDILDVSKIEAGEFTLQLSATSVYAIVNSCLNLVRPDANRKQIKLVSTVKVSQPIIQVDERRTRQILLNLLSNAVKFTPEGGKVGVGVFDQPKHRHTLFVIWDTGIGITPEDQERLFEPFVQVDSRLARQYDGTGLGLALSSRLAKLHGGTISVQSEPGRGSRFTVTIPWDNPMQGVHLVNSAERLRAPAPPQPTPV